MDEGDDFHVSAAFFANKRVYFVDFLEVSDTVKAKYILSLLIVAALLSVPCFADDGSATSPAAEPAPYRPVQMLDGFGAIFIGLAEPILFPIDQAKECKRKSGDQIHAGGCAFIGLLASPFLACRDVIVGTGDILTGGYYTLSRRVGVFDYFLPAPEEPVPGVGSVENRSDGLPPQPAPVENYPGYTRY